jgi:PleD family two-component response regulator
MPTLPEKPTADKPPLVLIVDDTPLNIELIATILTHEGCRIQPAESGAQALEYARELQPELILLDVIMPKMDGYQVCEALKQDALTQDIPVLFISCRGEVDAIARGLEAGALDYISKPFEPLELLSRVRTHLELARRRRKEHKLIAELQGALEQVKQLSGLLPICAHCKKVRDDGGFWQQVERYITAHSEATFSHGLCPDCIPIYFPDFKPSTKVTPDTLPQ